MPAGQSNGVTDQTDGRSTFLGQYIIYIYYKCIEENNAAVTETCNGHNNANTEQSIFAMNEWMDWMDGWINGQRKTDGWSMGV